MQHRAWRRLARRATGQSPCGAAGAAASGSGAVDVLEAQEAQQRSTARGRVAQDRRFERRPGDAAQSHPSAASTHERPASRRPRSAPARGSPGSHTGCRAAPRTSCRMPSGPSDSTNPVSDERSRAERDGPRVAADAGGQSQQRESERRRRRGRADLRRPFDRARPDEAGAAQAGPCVHRPDCSAAPAYSFAATPSDSRRRTACGRTLPPLRSHVRDQHRRGKEPGERAGRGEPRPERRARHCPVESASATPLTTSTIAVMTP